MAIGSKRGVSPGDVLASPGRFGSRRITRRAQLTFRITATNLPAAAESRTGLKRRYRIPDT
jgi:hypothetical protein